MMDEFGFVFLTILLKVSTTSSDRMLLLPAQDIASDIHLFSILGTELKAHGHNVSIVANDDMAFIVERMALNILTYEISEEHQDKLRKMQSVHQKSFFSPGNDMMSLYQRNSFINTDICKAMFSDKQFMQQIKESQYDLVIIDGLDYARCLYIIPYKFKLKYATLTSRHDPWLAGVPSLPSLEPYFANPEAPDTLTFLGRLRNAAMYIGSYTFLSSMSDDKLISQYVPNRPVSTFSYLYSKSEIFLVNLDTNCLEPPLISAPHYQYVGGLTFSEPKPLPEKIVQFLEDSGEAGAILVSFGNVAGQLPGNLLKALLKSFSRIEQKVIMNDVGEVPTDVLEMFTPKILIENWLPQNDILGHPKIKLFISHAGNNGQLEAVYHGVPMISIPVYGDQIHNARRVEKRGLGKTLSWRSITAKYMFSTIQDVLSNESYIHNIKQCSKMLQRLPNPRIKAVQMIEHVVEFGSSHLRPWMLNVPMMQVFMVDLILTILFGSAIFLFGFWWSCKSLCHKCKTFKVDEEGYLAKRAEKRRRITHHHHVKKE